MTKSSERLHVGVMGAGSIGCYVGGRLLAGDAANVTFVGRARLRDELAASGLSVRDFGDQGSLVDKERVVFELEPDCLGTVDVVLCCTKSAQTEEVARTLADVLRPEAIVVSLQNGMGNAALLRAQLQGRQVLAGIVGFNVVSQGGGVFQRTTSGPIMIEASEHPVAGKLAHAMVSSGIELSQPRDIASHQWTKLLVNLNNSISALSGAPTKQLLVSAGYRRILSAVIAEGLRVLRAAKIKPAKLRGLPVGIIPGMLRLPTFMVRVLGRAQMRVDPEARSSMYEDLRRQRLTEVDYLNGEIVALAERVGADAPINRRIVELVKVAEQAGDGSPQLSAEVLWQELTAAG